MDEQSFQNFWQRFPEVITVFGEVGIDTFELLSFVDSDLLTTSLIPNLLDRFPPPTRPLREVKFLTLLRDGLKANTSNSDHLIQYCEHRLIELKPKPSLPSSSSTITSSSSSSASPIVSTNNAKPLPTTVPNPSLHRSTPLPSSHQPLPSSSLIHESLETVSRSVAPPSTNDEEEEDDDDDVQDHGEEDNEDNHDEDNEERNVTDSRSSFIPPISSRHVYIPPSRIRTMQQQHNQRPSTPGNNYLSSSGRLGGTVQPPVQPTTPLTPPNPGHILGHTIVPPAVSMDVVKTATVSPCAASVLLSGNYNGSSSSSGSSSSLSPRHTGSSSSTSSSSSANVDPLITLQSRNPTLAAVVTANNLTFYPSSHFSSSIESIREQPPFEVGFGGIASTEPKSYGEARASLILAAVQLLPLLRGAVPSLKLPPGLVVTCIHEADPRALVAGEISVKCVPGDRTNTVALHIPVRSKATMKILPPADILKNALRALALTAEGINRSWQLADEWVKVAYQAYDRAPLHGTVPNSTIGLVQMGILPPKYVDEYETARETQIAKDEAMYRAEQTRKNNLQGTTTSSTMGSKLKFPWGRGGSLIHLWWPPETGMDYQQSTTAIANAREAEARNQHLQMRKQRAEAALRRFHSGSINTDDSMTK